MKRSSRLGAAVGYDFAAVGVDIELPGKLGDPKREGRGGIELLVLEAGLGAGEPSREGKKEVLMLAGGKRVCSYDLCDAMMKTMRAPGMERRIGTQLPRPATGGKNNKNVSQKRDLAEKR